MDGRLKSLLCFFTDGSFHTSAELAKALNISEKTVRVRIWELSDFLHDYGAVIQARQRRGYRLLITNPDTYQSFSQEIMEKETAQLPTTAEERISFLLAYLLCHEDYVKMDDLCDLLYISKNTLASDIKKVESYLEQYKVYILRRPNYGIKVMGAEFDIRLCIANYVIKRGIGQDSSLEISLNEQYQIAEIVMQVMDEMNINLSELITQNLVIHIYTAIKRMKHNRYIPFSSTLHKNVEQNIPGQKTIAEKISVRISEIFSINLPIAEIDYLAIHLGGKRIIGNQGKEEPNLIVSQEIYNLAGEMLITVYHTFKIDLRENLELRMSLCEHLVPLEIRLKYNMSLTNPLIEEIKSNYPFAYTVASQAILPVNQYYQKQLSDDEICYFAILFALVLDKKRENKKKRVLLVCASGKSTAQLLAYRYQEEFKDYISAIDICSLHNLSHIDFQDIDYVLTTIPIKTKIPVPILEIKMFLEDVEADTLKKALGRENMDFLLDFYKEDLFYTDLPCTTREEAIHVLCDKIKKVQDIPEKFEGAVLEREKLASTSYGNLIALPHPYEVTTKESFACVGVLSKPIHWSDSNKVQLIILISISDREHADIQKFYKRTSSFALNQKSVLEVLHDSRFSKFMELLSETE